MNLYGFSFWVFYSFCLCVSSLTCVMVLACSSGTSAGEPKLMPSIAEDLDRRTFLYNLIMPVMNQ